MSDEFFDGPIPGASFTEPVGTSAIQGPPKYTKPEDALAYVMTVALTQKSYNLMRAALELKDDEEYDAIMQQAADKRRILEGDEEPVEVEETEEKVSSVDIPKTGLMGN